jgi:hypothetical protein
VEVPVVVIQARDQEVEVAARIEPDTEVLLVIEEQQQQEALDLILTTEDLKAEDLIFNLALKQSQKK